MLYITHLDGVGRGYTHAALHWLMSLRAAGLPVRYVPLPGVGPTEWLALPSWAQEIANDPGPLQSELGLYHHTPDVVAKVARYTKLRWGLTTAETDRIPSWLAKRLNKTCEELIVPSMFNKQAFELSGVSVPIHVVPHALAGGISYAEKPLPPDPYTFYFVGNWNQRKNPEGVLRAYLRAFPKASPAVRLVLKLTGSFTIPDLTASIVEQEVGSAERMAQDIQVFCENWSERQIQALHDAGHCFVSLHRGEGFGLALLQAAMSGSSVMHTNWSAPLEFLPEEHHPRVPCDIVPVGAAMGHVPYFQGAEALRWAEPHMQAAVEMMRTAFAVGRTGTEEGAERLRQAHSWERIGAGFKEILPE